MRKESINKQNEKRISDLNFEMFSAWCSLYREKE